MAVCVVVHSLLGLTGCADSSQEGMQGAQASKKVDSGEVFAPRPMELRVGEEKFNKFCSPCHGDRAKGTDHGPPLVHKIYEPNHHGDFAFQRAAAQGVRAHHWHFGNMPKIEGVTPDEVTEIIRYVRWLQRQAGIY